MLGLVAIRFCNSLSNVGLVVIGSNAGGLCVCWSLGLSCFVAFGFCNFLLGDNDLGGIDFCGCCVPQLPGLHMIGSAATGFCGCGISWLLDSASARFHGCKLMQLLDYAAADFHGCLVSGCQVPQLQSYKETYQLLNLVAVVYDGVVFDDIGFRWQRKQLSGLMAAGVSSMGSRLLWVFLNDAYVSY